MFLRGIDHKTNMRAEFGDGERRRVEKNVGGEEGREGERDGRMREEGEEESRGGKREEEVRIIISLSGWGSETSNLSLE